MELLAAVATTAVLGPAQIAAGVFTLTSSFVTSRLVVPVFPIQRLLICLLLPCALLVLPVLLVLVLLEILLPLLLLFKLQSKHLGDTTFGTRGHNHRPSPAEEFLFAQTNVWMVDAPYLGVTIVH